MLTCAQFWRVVGVHRSSQLPGSIFQRNDPSSVLLEVENQESVAVLVHRWLACWRQCCWRRIGQVRTLYVVGVVWSVPDVPARLMLPAGCAGVR